MLSRRDLLYYGGLAAASQIIPSSLLSRQKVSEQGSAWSFAFYSDTHVSLDRNVKEGVEMLREMVGKHKIEFAVNGGDVTDYGWRGEYDSYKKLLEVQPFPVYHTMGNHDVRWSPLGVKIFRERLEGEYRHIVHRGLHVFVLDSTVPLSHWGHFEKVQLTWLERELKGIDPKEPIVIVTHHWVGRKGSQMVDNELDLLRLLQPYNVKFIFNGHGHSDLWWDWEGIPNTMNKGLYQGSYQVVTIDPEADTLTVTRRSADENKSNLQVVKLSREEKKAILWVKDIPTLPSLANTATFGSDAVWNGSVANSDRGSVNRLAPGYQTLIASGPQGRFVSTVKVENDDSPLREEWSVPVGGGVMSHLVFDDQEENLFVSTLSGTLHKIDARTGREQWVARTGGYCHSTPAVADGVVVVGSADASVHAFSESRGTQLWRFETAGPVYGGATIVNDTVAIASGDGRVYGLDLKSGSKKWEFELPASNTAFAQSRACTDGKLVFVGAWDWHTYGIDAESGKQVWRTICCERSFAYSPAIGSPAYAFGAVYVPANGNRLWKLNAATGEVIWSVSSEGDKFGHSSPRVEGSRVYVAGLGEKGKLMCLDAVSGEELWAGYTGSTIYDSSPAIGEDYVVIGSVGSLLSAFDKSSGAHLGSYRLRDGHFLASPAVRGNRVFAATFNDRITALKLER